MSNFPQNYDDDTTLPVVNDNLTEIGGEAINALRDAVVNIEMNIGLGAAGTTPSIAARLGLLINPDGTPNASAITSLGLVTLPIFNNQIADNAGIPESKLVLDYRTQDLFNYIRDLSRDVNLALGWINVSGVKLEPHLIGAIYRHDLAQIDVAETSSEFLDNKFRVPRNNDNSYDLINDMNNELLAHQWADGSPFGTIQNVVTNNGSTYPSNYAHTASGIFLQTSRFQTIPQTDQDVQAAFEFIDQSSILLLGTRIQNLYANGISVNSRSSSLTIDGYGQSVVPTTSAVAYLLAPSGNSSTPVDSITNGDDIIQFMPSQPDGYLFDEQFALVVPGDIVRINYGTIEVAFVIKEKKYIPGTNGNDSSFYVRIAGKNLLFTTTASARIDKPLFNNNKYGVLAVASANNPLTGVASSLIVGSPRGAQALGVGFNPDQFDSTHYLLYLALFPTGNLSDGYTILPAIDVTGNRGATPGAYTLDSVVSATNTAFRQAGFNYRFIAFSYQGNFGIMLADSYNNASFSIISVVISPLGAYDPVNTSSDFPNNVVGTPPTNIPDPLGFGPLGANIASPPYMNSYGSAAAAQFPTKLFVPLSRNNFYVNGVEEQRLNLEEGQALDGYGDGYWNATITTVTPGSNSVAVTYTIPLDLATSDLKVGKTIVVQSAGTGELVNFGRFIITNVNFVGCPAMTTEITVYDAVHATGVSPSAVLSVGSPVFIYFCSDSVAFNSENSSDFNTYVPGTAVFKRYFEVYMDDLADTYTNERGRLNTNGNTVTINGVSLFGSSALSFVNIIAISPKLVGFSSGGVTKINLQIFGYDQTTGLFDGYLCNYDGTSVTSPGPLTFGQKGLVTRFYDNTNIDYVDILFSATDNVPEITSPKNIDIQLFPTLSLDQEIMLLGTCQFNDQGGQVTFIEDEREFGNTSEEQFTTSAIAFIEAPTRELHENGIIRGFDVASASITTVAFTGGVAVVNGSIVQVNPQTVDIPIVWEALPIVVGGAPSATSTVNTITWFVCVNEDAEIELIASTDYNLTSSFVSQYTTVQVNHLRLFYVVNPNVAVPTPYPVRGTYFNSLVLTQKDVTPIATITATVTSSGTSYVVTASTVTDARRYVANGYGGLSEPLTLGLTASFRSAASILNWLSQLNNFVSASTAQSNAISNKVIVKGHLSITSTMFVGFAFNEVFFEGEGDGSLDVYVSTGFALGNNVHFHGLYFNYIYDPVVFGDVGYSTTNLINSGKGLMYMGVPFGGGNVSIRGCHFTWFPSVTGINNAPSTSTAVNRYSFINVEVAGPAANNPPVVLQDVDVSENTFSDTTLSSFVIANIESARAAVSVVCLSTTTNAAGGGVKLVNVTIDDNVCDKDQLLAIVPTYNTSSGNVINAAFNTTACTINNNTCGAISSFTQYDVPIDVDFTSDYFDFIADKNNGLTISGNTCKYITATDSTGLDIAFTFPTINVSSGPINVFNNTCSWIKLVPNVAAGAAAVMPCNVKNNTLLAYDTNFKKSYLNGGSSGLTNSAIELVLIGSGLSTLALIDGNSINAGGYDTIVPALTVFAYDFGISSSHDAKICNNTILNLAQVISGAAPIGINLSTQVGVNIHSDINHNTFYRFATVWQAYINLGFAGNHTVVFNSFDQITADGTGTQISGTTSKSNIHDNANQNGYKPIALTDGAYFFSAISNGAVTPTGPAAGSNLYNGTDLLTADVVTLKYSDGFTPTSNNSIIYEFLPSGFGAYTFPKSATFNIPLSEFLPVGVRILQIQLGVWLKVNGSPQAGLNVTTNTNNAVTLSLFTSTDALDTISGHVITDIANNIFPSPLFTGTDYTNAGGSPQTYTVLVYSAASSGSNYSVVTQATAQGGTQFLTVTPSTNITVGQGYRINAQIDINWLISTITGGSNPNLAGDAIVWYFSPLLVRYTW
jgi:hypothetical protein